MAVDSISGLGSAASNQSTNPLAGGATMGKEDFLKLLVAQLAHQDPLQPMDNTQFVTQLSQFSGLEQLMGINQNLSVLQLTQASMTNGQVAGLIGREVEVRGDMLRHPTTGPAAITFELPAAAQEVKLTISDAQGHLLRTLPVGSRPAGVGTVAWDGKDAAGNMVPAGNYHVEVAASDAEGGKIAASMRYSGLVRGVTFKDGIPLLEVGDSTIQVADVLAVRQAGASSAGQ